MLAEVFLSLRLEFRTIFMAKLKENIKKIALKNGGYLGGVLILITLFAYLYNWDLLLKSWFQLLKFGLVILLAVFSTMTARRENPAAFSFRDAFTAYFIPIALGLFAFTIFNSLLFDLIDGQAGHYISQMSIEEHRKQLEAIGKDADKINQTISSLKKSDQFSILNQLQGYIMNLILYCIPGIIVAAIFKKKKPIIT